MNRIEVIGTNQGVLQKGAIGRIETMVGLGKNPLINPLITLSKEDKEEIEEVAGVEAVATLKIITTGIPKTTIHMKEQEKKEISDLQDNIFQGKAFKGKMGMETEDLEGVTNDTAGMEDIETKETLMSPENILNLLYMKHSLTQLKSNPHRSLYQEILNLIYSQEVKNAGLKCRCTSTKKSCPSDLGR